MGQLPTSMVTAIPYIRTILSCAVSVAVCLSLDLPPEMREDLLLDPVFVSRQVTMNGRVIPVKGRHTKGMHTYGTVAEHMCAKRMRAAHERTRGMIYRLADRDMYRDRRRRR